MAVAHHESVPLPNRIKWGGYRSRTCDRTRDDNTEGRLNMTMRHSPTLYMSWWSIVHRRQIGSWFWKTDCVCLHHISTSGFRDIAYFLTSPEKFFAIFAAIFLIIHQADRREIHRICRLHVSYRKDEKLLNYVRTLWCHRRSKLLDSDRAECK